MSQQIDVMVDTHHDQAHLASGMVAQQGSTLQEASNDPTATLSLVPAMAAAAGLHDPAAMASGPRDTPGQTAIFDLSVSPKKDESALDAAMTGGSSRRRLDHSHTPSDRNRSGSRSGSVKRSSDAGGRPPRGRPDSPWDDDLRAVHRRVQYPDDPNASVQTALQALQRQSEADRDHMAMLKHAIETIYVSQRQQMVDVTSAAQRSDRIEGTITSPR